MAPLFLIAFLSSNTYSDMSIPTHLPAFPFRETPTAIMGYELCGGWEFSINLV